MTHPDTLDVARILDRTQIVLLGGTGFLGKLFLSMLLDRYPRVGRVFLVVRSKVGSTPEARFWSEATTSEPFEPLRRTHGEGFVAFLREKVAVVEGDMGKPLCGLSELLVHELRGTVDAVVNLAGVVDFNPALDEALEANAFGAQNIVALSRALGRVPILHTSTCYVAGTRPGPIREDDPRSKPFPRCDELGAELWDPAREIAECLDLVTQANQRSEDAFRQSEFAKRASEALAARGEPSHGPPYVAEFARVKRKFVRERLVEAGLDRATHWGWPNIYLYTKAIGEQVVSGSGLPFTIARPACCESCVAFPAPSYNEGVNTSAPLIYLMMKGELQVLAQHVPLDLIPTDYVVAGMILALTELLEGTAAPVYQFAASDINPCTAQRFGELVGLYKRRYFQGKAGGNPIFNAIQSRLEPTFVDRARFEATGAPTVAKVARSLASFVRKAAPAFSPAAKALESLSRREEKIADVQRLFEPFAAKTNGPFDCSNTRRAFGRLSADDKARLPWAPETIDWADWMMNVHMPAMEKRIVPEIDRKLKRAPKPLSPHGSLVSLVDDMAERHGGAVALQLSTPDGLTRTTFADIQRCGKALATRLARRGVKKGDRVVLSAQNHPDWVIAFYGIVRTGAAVVPVDPTLDVPGWGAVLDACGPSAIIWNDTALFASTSASRDALALRPHVFSLDLHAAVHDAVDEGEALAEVAVDVHPSDAASVFFATGTPEAGHGAVVTHETLTSLVASLSTLFPLSGGDVVLSVLPLHLAFELTCGMLLPLSRGARIVYAGEATDGHIAVALRESRATAVVGVPAIWQMLERHILRKADAHGPVARGIFNAALEANGWFSNNAGIDVGRLLFGSVHHEVGGNLRWLISGGGSLPPETRERLARIGLPLTQMDQALSGNMDFGIAPDGDEAHARVLRPSGARPLADGGVKPHLSPATDESLVLPESLQDAGKAVVGKVLDFFYGDVMKPHVFGRSHIPYNRNVIVVANHASHLDMGFVRFALGKYGEDIVSLAAQDYFFDGGVRRTFFENLTNLKAIDRHASLRQSIRQAGEVIKQGKTVLVFPEGTRSATGEVNDFKPMVGHLALTHGVDILPIHLGGTYAAMSRGTPVPLRRDIVARIGPPLRAQDLRRLTAGLAAAPAAREVARLAQAAVVALRDGQVLDLERVAQNVPPVRSAEHPLVRLFSELEGKFRAGEVERPVSFYVTLGSAELSKWTVRVDAQRCEVRPGKPAGGPADCVLKTSPELFARIVRESYVPSPMDFVSGAFKSNDVRLLVTFQKVFCLDKAS